MTPAAARRSAMSSRPAPFGMMTIFASVSGPGFVYWRSAHQTTPPMTSASTATTAAAAPASRASHRVRRGGAGPKSRGGGEDEAGIRAAEAEGVGQRVADRPFLRLLGHEIDVAARRRVVEVQRRRAHAVADRHDRENGLDAAGGAEQVADRRFGR